MDRQTTVLALPLYYGFDLRICPGEQSLDLIVATQEAIREGDTQLHNSIREERDKLLYERLLTDLQCRDPSQARNCIVYWGPEHGMAQLRQTTQFDVAFVDIKKGDGGAVEISGTLPYPPHIGKQPEVLAYYKAEIAQWLQNGPIPIVVNLDYRPRQLKEN